MHEWYNVGMKNNAHQPPPVIDMVHCVFMLAVACGVAYTCGEAIVEQRYVVGACLCAISLAIGLYVWSFLTGGRFSD